MMTHIQDIQIQQHDYAGWPEHNIGDLIEQILTLLVRMDYMIQYMHHVGVSPPHIHGRGRHGWNRACGRR